MKKRGATLILAVMLGLPLAAQQGSGSHTVRTLSTALANSLYCQLVGCTMTGKLRLINGTAAAPSADSAAGAGFHFTATAFAIDVGGNTSTICGQGCATVTGGTWSWSSSATDATASSDLKMLRVAANKLGWGGSGAGQVTHDFSSLTAARVVTWSDAATSIPIASQVITFSGPTAARTVTLPDANFTAARTDAGNQFTGNQGVNTAPSGTVGQHLVVGSSADQNDLIRAVNTNAVGTSALAGVTAAADTAFVSIIGHGTGNTSSRAGVSVGGLSEVIANSLLVGTTSGALRLYTNSTAAVIIDTSQSITYPTQAPTAGLTPTVAAASRRVVSSYPIANADVVSLGASTTGDITVCTLVAKQKVLDAAIVIDTPDTSANALTIAFGRTSAAYIDYIVASDAKAAANTVYGDVSAERGTNLTGYDLPSYTGTTALKLHFIKTTTNLSTVTGFTAHVIVVTEIWP